MGIIVIGSSNCEYMAVSCITHPFIPLGTICRDLDIVGPLSPKYIVIELLDILICGMEETCPFH